MKRVLLALVVLTAFLSMVFGQTLTVEPFAFSDRDVAADTASVINRTYLGILTTHSSGLTNVGVDAEMYFKGTYHDSTLTASTWELVTKPTSSIATLVSGDAVVYDAISEVIAFTPDLVGTYEIAFFDGAVSDTVLINVGTYVGMYAATGDGGCSLCHADKVADWEGTGHSDMLKRALNGTLSSHYASYCIGCHTTGYDPNAVNGGFDDLGFVWPDSATIVGYNPVATDTSGHLFDGLFGLLETDYPDAFGLANIQCESCHGPGSQHIGNAADSRIVSELGTGNCAVCHDSGTHHAYPEQWDVSGHADPPTYYSGEWSSSCARCHTPEGFIEYGSGAEVTAHVATNPFSCAMCHDPHAVNTAAGLDAHMQLRTVAAVTLTNGHVITDGGNGKLCMNCHMTRREANSYSDEPHSHYGPHYGVQADMLAATNAVTFGKKLPSSPHLMNEGSCISCHMSGNDHVTDDDGQVILMGGHTFAMTDTAGVENTHACEPCHGLIAGFAEKKAYFNGMADHDGDGTDEGLQEEVHGLMDILATMLPHADTVAAYDAHDDVDDTWTVFELKGAYNYDYVYYDHSYGIHNPDYTVALLKVTIDALTNSALEGDIVAIDDVPNDQGNAVRIIWEKAAGDGFGLGTYFVERHDKFPDVDTTWTRVAEVTANGSKRYAVVVPTVFNTATEFRIVAGGYISLPASGTSVDNLVPAAPTSVIAALSGGTVDLSWVESDAPDVNYYTVYRSTTPGFTPSATNEIGSTTDLVFSDAVTVVDEYFYRVAAVDFNDNLGEFSAEVTANYLSVDNSVMPAEYSLAQNFPNPFNPTTTIHYSMKATGKVKLAVFDATGREVATLVNELVTVGAHQVVFNGNNLASGVYFYRLTSPGFTSMKKMLLLK